MATHEQPRLISAPWVLPIVTSPLADGAVVVDAAGVVLDVGPRASVRRRHSHLPEQRAQGALLPALVNAHTHIGLSALAGRVPGGRGLVAWVGELMAQGASPSAADKRTAAAQAAQTAVAAGTAAVAEVANDLHMIPALASAGLRGVVFHELLGSRDRLMGDALAEAGAEYEALRQRGEWPVEFAHRMAPHAPYSASPTLLRRIFAACANAGVATSIHVAEDPDEIALLTVGEGAWVPWLQRLGVPAGERTPHLRPLPYLQSLGAFGGKKPPLLVHMVELDDEDRRIAAAHQAYAVLCVRSNLHIGGRIPNVPALLSAGVPLALGTDSLASAPDLSLWGELSVLSQHFPAVPPNVWLTAATHGGATALGLARLGGIAPGFKPGLLDVALPDLGAPVESLVHQATPALRWMAHP